MGISINHGHCLSSWILQKHLFEKLYASLKFFPALLGYNWYIACISLRFTTSDLSMLQNDSHNKLTSITLHSFIYIYIYIFFFFFVVRTFKIYSLQFSSVQSLSHVQLFATQWITSCQASLPIINSWNLPKLMSIEAVMPYNYLSLCCPILLLSSIFPSIRVFSNESAFCIRWPKYWSFSFNIVLPMNTQNWSISNFQIYSIANYSHYVGLYFPKNVFVLYIGSLYCLTNFTFK